MEVQVSKEVPAPQWEQQKKNNKFGPIRVRGPLPVSPLPTRWHSLEKKVWNASGEKGKQ